MDNRQNGKQPYTYIDAGFNGFMKRTIDSGNAITLGQSASDFRRVNNQQVNFDHQQTTGNLGSIIQAGSITIDGTGRRISVYDENGNEVVRIGKLDD